VLQVVKFRGKTLCLRVQKFLKGERTVGILHGEFTKSREPSDLVEEQGGYGGRFTSKAQGERGS
jgi:hypothetical protein